MITALIPAHQEEGGIAEAIQSLRNQSLSPDQIVVVADNCTDRTAEIAESAGAIVFVSEDNSDRKAGALNQAFRRLEPQLADSDLVLVMDADTTLVPDFIEIAVERMVAAPGLSAIGGVFRGTPPRSLLEQAQFNEWVRYSRQLKRTGKVFVLTGTAALIRCAAMREIMSLRGTRLPGHRGDLYNRDAATEDFCLTVAMKRLGLRMASPSGCVTVTELMPSFSMLWAQRTRWYGGALQVLGMFGLNRVTLPYFFQQLMIIVGIIGMTLYLLTTTLLLTSQQLRPSAWVLLGLVFWLERVVTVWAGGRRARLFAIALLPEILYDVFLQGAFVVSCYRRIRRQPIAWKHVPAAAAQKVGQPS